MKKEFLSAIFLVVSATPSLAQEEAPAPVCRATPEGRALDFWTGNYSVVSNGEDKTQYGTNLIEMTLDGCAIIENWTGAGGGEGKSLFYFDARENTWTQIWVTGDTSQPWGLKVKKLIGIYDTGAVRFQSRQKLDAGKSYLDRTTLAPMEDGTFRQLIEISKDGGETWETSFDAIYVPKGN